MGIWTSWRMGGDWASSHGNARIGSVLRVTRKGATMSPPPAGAAATVEAARERSMSVSFPAVTASVRKVRHALVTFARAAGATTDKIEAIRVVASEAATNVVAHAYDGVPG